ncbi:MAG: type II toxin-antitoxin system VapC family toxin, partial [Cellvibrionaceae bacterium]|nr:type II toxin-antitoxin system VapC family toxin [Cellvibrionaceae bacterium]
LVQDDPKQAAVANEFIEKTCTEESPCFIGHITLCEIAWVLQSNYQQDRESIANVIEQLLHVGQLELMGPGEVWQALKDYGNSNADFPDHLIARVNEALGCEATVSFDKKAARQPGFELLA